MTTPQVTTRTNLVQRTAFTLVELLVVISIIGILVGIATPFIFQALNRAREFTIENEMVQIDASVRKFETQYGFFPPTIGPGMEIDTSAPAVGVATFRRYLNRIAPNHTEGNGTDGRGLAKWWTEVGVNLDDRSSLVFWLSGLCTSKQYPLSGNSTIADTPELPALAPYNANRDVNNNEITTPPIDRQEFFGFNSGQLVANSSIAGIQFYNQPNGRGDSLAFRYRDFKSYAGSPNAYHNDVDTSQTPNRPNFFNPDSFQIVGPGMDGEYTNGTAGADTSNLFDPTQDDNITNFSGGRLELVFE